MDQSYQAAVNQLLSGETPEAAPQSPATEIIQPEPVVTQTQEDVLRETAPEALDPQEPTPPAAPENPWVSSEIIEPGSEAPADTANTAPQFDGRAWLKETLGEEFESIDALKARLNTPAQIVPDFANDESKLIYEALAAGKVEEVTNYLTMQKQVNDLQGKSPEEIVKAHIKLTNPAFDARDIEDEFKERYTVDEEQYSFDDSKLTREKKKAEQRLKDDATKAQEYFARYQQEIKLPTITAPQAVEATTPTVDMTSDKAKAALAFVQKLNGDAQGDVFNVPYEFKDDNISLKGQVKIPQSEVETIKNSLNGHEELYIMQTYLDQEGNFNQDKFASDIWFLKNKANIIKAAVADATHQTRIAELKRNRNFREHGPLPTGSIVPGEQALKVSEFERLFNVPQS